jgi:hypothetical protein
MPHVREVRATSHDDHDAMLVAALAAGDVAGTDRDQAIALIDGCSDCASLHDDLVAIARATSTLPPPIAMPNRDFRISPQQAAALRPRGWRRLLPSGLAGSAFARPLGVGLATFGLIGLLVTNVPIGIGLGGAASAPAPYSAGGGGAAAPMTADSNAPASVGTDTMAEGAAASAPSAVGYPAASAAPSTRVVPAASGIRTSSTGTTTGEAVPGSAATANDGLTPASSGKVSIAGGSGPTASDASRPAPTARDLSSSGGLAGADLRNLLFVAAIAVGLGLLLLARRTRRLA